jgi:ABC-2 type transport system permease protein
MNSLSLARIGAIIRREYVFRVKNKWFLITTFGLPLLMIGLSTAPAWLASRGGGKASPLYVGVVATAPMRAVDVPALLHAEDDGIAADMTDRPPSQTTDRLATELRDSDFDAFLVIGDTVARGGSAVLLSKSVVPDRRKAAIRRAVRSSLVAAGLQQAGIPAAEVTTALQRPQVGLSIERVGQEGVAHQDVLAVLAMVLCFVLYMMFIVYGQVIVRGVLEEKNSDIVEVLISSVRPSELMLGKVLGIGAVGLTQIGIWAVTVGLLALYGLSGAMVALSQAGVDLSGVSLPYVGIGLAFLAYYVLGFLLYASAFAAVGALVGDDQQAQQMNFPVMLLIIVPFVLAFSGINTPDAGWLAAASLFPFFSPILMLVRIVTGVAATWQIVTSLILLVLTIWGVSWVAGRIYRVGILMKGKRPTLPEMIRWLRYG